MTIHVLFVCLGNICRSPMAEAIFQKLVIDANLGDKFVIESAGTGGWHVGDPAHGGTRKVLAKHGINYRGQSAQISHSDVQDQSKYIIAMDSQNTRDLRAKFGDLPRMHRLLSFSEQVKQTDRTLDVPDPYYSGGFDKVYDLVLEGCVGLLDHIRQQHNL